MSKFLLALYDDPAEFAHLSPEEMQKVIQEYSDWAAGLAKRGLHVGGNKLADEPGKVLRGGRDKLAVIDGPYSETKEVLGGFMILRATSYDEAVELCRDCPHLNYGGTIELREIESTGEQ